MVGQGAHRKRVERLYEDTCDVYAYRHEPQAGSKLVRPSLVCVMQGIPCRLSFKTEEAGTRKTGTTAIGQQAVLFLAPEWEIKPGSKVEVLRFGRRIVYKSSGAPAVYPSHQEITLDLWEERA